MVNCAAFGCNNRSRNKKNDTGSFKGGFYRIPAIVTSESPEAERLSKKRRREWQSRLKRVDLDDAATHYRVCGMHFVSGKPSALFDVDHPDWAPSLNLGYKGKDPDKNGRYNRRKARRAAASERTLQTGGSGTSAAQDHPPAEDGPLVEGSLSAEDGLPAEDVESQQGGNPAPSNGQVEQLVQTRGTQADDGSREIVDRLKQEVNRLRVELYSLRESLNARCLTYAAFQRDDELTKFYTGLPNFQLLDAVFTLVKGLVRHSSINALPQFQEYVVTLIRLRLNVPLRDLAFRFDVSEATVSRIVMKWIDGLYFGLERLVRWPTREQLKRTMPMCFRVAFGTDVAVILDCFEIFIERPTSHHARCLTWSQYKHHNTVKYLIGVAPQGTVTYISRGWCGRSSDKLITESCGILGNLQPGDLILADRGFTIAESVGLCSARLKMPAFTRGQAQLTPWQVEATRKLANVRIHVERVIGLLRNKYMITKSIVPVDMLSAVHEDDATTLDKIVFVCCALTSACGSVVQFD